MWNVYFQKHEVNNWPTNLNVSMRYVALVFLELSKRTISALYAMIADRIAWYFFTKNVYWLLVYWFGDILKYWKNNKRFTWSSLGTPVRHIVGSSWFNSSFYILSSMPIVYITPHCQYKKRVLWVSVFWKIVLARKIIGEL